MAGAFGSSALGLYYQLHTYETESVVLRGRLDETWEILQETEWEDGERMYRVVAVTLTRDKAEAIKELYR